MFGSVVKYVVVMVTSSSLVAGVMYDYWATRYENIVKEYELLNAQAKWERDRLVKDYEDRRVKANEEYADSINELNSINSRVLNSREAALRSLERRLATVTKESGRVSVEYSKLLDAVRGYSQRVYELTRQCDSDRVILNNVKEWSVEAWKN